MCDPHLSCGMDTQVTGVRKEEGGRQKVNQDQRENTHLMEEEACTGSPQTFLCTQTMLFLLEKSAGSSTNSGSLTPTRDPTILCVFLRVSSTTSWDMWMGSKVTPLWTMHCSLSVHTLVALWVLLWLFWARNSSTLSTTRTKPTTPIRMGFPRCSHRGGKLRIVGKQVTGGRADQNHLRTLVAHPGNPPPLDMTWPSRPSPREDLAYPVV